MKTTIFSSLFLLATTPLALAQTTAPVKPVLDRAQAVEVQVDLPAPPEGPRVLPTAEVSITYIEPVMAFAPGRVEILGTNLGLVREARVAGVVVPIVFNNGRRMVITPGEQTPGFANLELMRVGGKAVGRMEFTPCLSAEWRGGRARLQLHPGAEGWYLVQYSFRRLDNPIAFPGIHYGEMLDLSGQCGTFYSGLTFGDEAMAFPWMRVPAWAGPSVVGPMHVQALCLVDGEVSYSNLVTLQPRL